MSATAVMRKNPAATAALLVAAGGAATILGAYFFEYALRLAPCPLCLEQRIPYYVAIPLALVVAIAALRGAPRPLVVGGLLVLALVMLVGTGLGVYHAGVEWKFWEGPRDCSGPITNFGNAGSLLEQMQRTTVVRCDEIPWSFLGLSLAGYNVLITLALAAVALWGLLASKAR